MPRARERMVVSIRRCVKTFRGCVGSDGERGLTLPSLISPPAFSVDETTAPPTLLPDTHSVGRRITNPKNGERTNALVSETQCDVDAHTNARGFDAKKRTRERTMRAFRCAGKRLTKSSHAIIHTPTPTHPHMARARPRHLFERASAGLSSQESANGEVLAMSLSPSSS